MIRQLREFLDSRFPDCDREIAFNAGSFTELVRMDYRDVERLVRPKVPRFGPRV